MSKLEPVLIAPKKFLEVASMTKRDWEQGARVEIGMGRDEEWGAHVFRFTDEEGVEHSILFIPNVRPEDLEGGW